MLSAIDTPTTSLAFNEFNVHFLKPLVKNKFTLR